MLQRSQAVLEQERNALQRQLEQDTAAAADKQQQLEAQAADLRQQLEAMAAQSHEQQRQLEAVQLELCAAKQEAAAAGSQLKQTATDAEQLLMQVTASCEATLQGQTAAYNSSLQQLCERLQWLCSAYFAPAGPSEAPCSNHSGGQHTQAAGVAQLPPASDGRQQAAGGTVPCMTSSTPASPRSVGAETTREGPCAGHTASCAAPPAASSCSSTGLYGTKLEHLRQCMVGDSEHLLQLFEQYKLHKQKLLDAANCNNTGSSSSSDSNQHPEGCILAAQGSGSTPPMRGKSPLQDPACTSGTQKQSPQLTERSKGASAGPGVGSDPSSSSQDLSSPWCLVAQDGVMQAQQQILQLEACLLKFMLSLQEALDEARHQQQQQHSSSSSTLGSARTSPSRLERPGTAMSSSSSRCTDATGLSSRSSSLGSQLLSAMRREKQQLAQELRRMQSLARAPRGGAAAAVFPWQRIASSTGVSSSSTHCWTAASSASYVREGLPVDAGTAEAVVGGPQPEPQADPRSWEEVDEVLQLLAGCQLDQPTNRHTGSTQAEDTTALVGSTAATPGHLMGTRPGASPCRANRQHYSGQAAAAAGRAPARSTSLGYGGCVTHPTSPPRLMKSISCGVPRCGVVQPQERGIGSLKARR